MDTESVECWEGGRAKIDKFRSVYHERAKDMDALHLAVMKITKHVRKVQTDLKKVADATGTTIDNPNLQICLGREYVEGNEIDEKSRDITSSLVYALASESMDDLIDKLGYERICVPYVANSKDDLAPSVSGYYNILSRAS